MIEHIEDIHRYFKGQLPEQRKFPPQTGVQLRQAVPGDGIAPQRSSDACRRRAECRRVKAAVPGNRGIRDPDRYSRYQVRAPGVVETLPERRLAAHHVDREAAARAEDPADGPVTKRLWQAVAMHAVG